MPSLCAYSNRCPLLRLPATVPPLVSIVSPLTDPSDCITYLRKINTKSINTQPIQKARKALREPRQTLMHQLQMHKIRLQIRHAITQLRKALFKDLQRRITLSLVRAAAAQAVATRWTEGCCWARTGEGTRTARWRMERTCEGARARRCGERNLVGV